MLLTHAGDYQTQQRMELKRRAIPLPDFAGKRVLDVGCDHGYWCKLVSDLGASRVVGLDRGRHVRGPGFVNLAQRNRLQQWPNCEFYNVDLGREWPMLGEFDVVICLSLYHHIYGQTGNHERIWQWLAMHTALVGGVLLWEGPYDTRDSIARKVTATVGDYSHARILEAAKKYFAIEIIGPAMHRSHREVWRGLRKCDENRGCGVQRSRKGEFGVQRAADARRVGDGGLVSASGDAQRASGGSGELAAGGGRSGTTIVRNRGGHEDRAIEVVAREDNSGGRGRVRGAGGAGSEERDHLPRVGDTGVDAARVRVEERRPRVVHPEWAIVLGGSSEVWEDLLAWEEIYGRQWDGVVIVVNDVGSHWPRYLDHWCTLHPNKLDGWKKLREHQGLPGGYKTWGRRNHMTDRKIVPWAGGASGMLAVQVAQEVGCVRAIMCGIPMTPTPHFTESTEHGAQKWTSVAGHWRAWSTHMPKMQGWVRSMAGRTQEHLGKPTLEWLLEGVKE